MSWWPNGVRRRGSTSSAARVTRSLTIGLARRAGAAVALVHVFSAGQAARAPEHLDWHGAQRPVEPLRDYLEALTGRLAKMFPVRFRSVLLRSYWPEQPFCETADREADIVVMATPPRGWARFWRGSFSAGVARYSRTPVLLVPGRKEPPDFAEVPAPARILVPLDGSAEAERVLGPAVALASLSAGRCKLLQVVSSRRSSGPNWSLAHGGGPARPNVDRDHKARGYLRGIANRLRARSVAARWQVVTDDHPIADAVIRHAEAHRVDAIALVGCSGGLSRLFRKSVTGLVARRADVPVLICRSDVLGLAP